MEGVCEDCAKKRGARIPKEHRPTWWVGKCIYCGKKKTVTAKRDFGVTRKLLE